MIEAQRDDRAEYIIWAVEDAGVDGLGELLMGNAVVDWLGDSAVRI